MERYGIDVSKYQGAIDWGRVKRAGIKALDGVVHPLEFAFIRAGYSGWAGGLHLDEQFARNIDQATRQGVPVGVYVYSYAKSPAAVQDTANAVLDAVQDYGSVPIVLDLEDAETYAPLGKAKTAAIARAFIDRVREKRRPVLLYTYTAFAQSYVDLAAIDCPKWIADYRGYCGMESPDIWQFSSKGKVDGINGNVDLNVSYTDKCPLKTEEAAAMKGVRYIGDFNDALDAAMVCAVIAKGGHACEVVPYHNKWGVLVTQLKAGVQLGDFVSALELLAGLYNCGPEQKK